MAPVSKNESRAIQAFKQGELLGSLFRVGQVFRFVDKVEELVGVRAVHRHEACKRRAETFQVIGTNLVRRFKITADRLLHELRNAVIQRVDNVPFLGTVQRQVVVEQPDHQTPIARPPIWRAR